MSGGDVVARVRVLGAEKGVVELRETLTLATSLRSAGVRWVRFGLPACGDHWCSGQGRYSHCSVSMTRFTIMSIISASTGGGVAGDLTNAPGRLLLTR